MEHTLRQRAFWSLKSRAVARTVLISAPKSDDCCFSIAHVILKKLTISHQRQRLRPTARFQESARMP